jgi:hypothetical protein
MVAAIGGVTAAWNLATAAVNGFKIAAGIAAFVSGSAVATAGAVAAGAATGGYMQGVALAEASQLGPRPDFSPGGGGLFPGAFGYNVPAPRPTQNVTINVNNGNVTADEIVRRLERLNKNSGGIPGALFR